MLQTDAHLSNVALADRIGLSPSPCLRRVHQLESQGVIAGYVALLDRRKIGLDVMAFVEVRVDRHNDSVAEAFRTAILREPEVVSCHALSGAYDYLLKVAAPNLDSFAEFAMKRLLKMPGVTDVRSSFILDTLKDSTAYPLGHLEA